MKNAKKKPRSSKNGRVPGSFKFHNRIDKLDFQIIPEKETLKVIVKDRMVRPKRATVENALQSQYKYSSPTKLAVKLLTGTINGKFNPKGSMWMHLVNAKDEKLFTREFYKIEGSNPLERLSAYGHLGKNIADSKPKGMQLVMLSEIDYAWQSKDGKHIIFIKIKDYLCGLNKKDKAFILSNESKRNSYLRRSANTIQHRQREIQKKWK